MKSLPEIVNALKRPLLFAGKDDGIHIPNVKGLDRLVRNLSREAESLPIPVEWKAFFHQLPDRFAGFDELEIPAKMVIVQDSLRRLEELEAGAPPYPVTRAANRHSYEESRLLLARPLDTLMGSRAAERMKRAKGIETVEDALYHLPRVYQDRRHFRPISRLRPGQVEAVMGEVVDAKFASYAGRRIFEVMVRDEHGYVTAKWFRAPLYLRKAFSKGRRIILCGKIEVYRGMYEFHHPDFEAADELRDDSPHFLRIVPIYPASEGLSPKMMRRIMRPLVEECAGRETDGIPWEIRMRMRLMDLSEALRRIHFPPADEDIDALNAGRSPAHRRIKFDEAFFLELALLWKRRGIARETGVPVSTPPDFLNEAEARLPFALTPAQRRVLAEILRDMAGPHPMNRLVQGDVGSGKTVVAVLAGLAAIRGGCQAALMAPTEILAQQHARTLERLLAPWGCAVGLLTGSRSVRDRADLQKRIRRGEIPFVVGTHALIQKGVEFPRLGLAIIDEQHRFGVLQRSDLCRRNGGAPHTLVMTATPIPRTLTLTVYGDLEVSLIDELPKGRRPVQTRVVSTDRRSEIYADIRRELDEGRQGYVVYPLVEESEKIDLRDATRMAKQLQKILAGHEVALIHGKMSRDEKEGVMSAFQEGRVRLLVATTVVEVGIDVPNATVMVVEHAERFGLSQLHQLRGRVGRGAAPALCLLVADNPYLDRLKVMEATSDGFRIAEADVELRGPGDIFGTRQWGESGFRVVNVIRDLDLLMEARREAGHLLERDPELRKHGLCRAVLNGRWGGRLALADVG